MPFDLVVDIETVEVDVVPMHVEIISGRGPGDCHRAMSTRHCKVSTAR
jgi:hypothetical protein